MGFSWRTLLLSVWLGSFCLFYAPAALHAQTGEPPPIPTGGNIYLVELRVNFGSGWFRLATGPRPENEARQLFVDLHRHLMPFRHVVTLYNFDTNTVDDEVRYEAESRT